MARSRPATLVLSATVLVAACSAEPEVPPLFNAIDRSLSCPAGEVGWDFSTGGFDDDVSNAVQSNELRILEATFGGNCEGIVPGNWTERFAASCNGNVQCTRRVAEATDPDVKLGCYKDFKVRYACGVQQQTYELSVEGEAGGKTIDLRCGEVINISRASYGTNCKASLKGNLTSKVSDLCSGTRRCLAPSGLDLFGSDPVGGCVKTTEVSYFCGNDREEKTATFPEYAKIDFECPVRATPVVGDATISISTATFGPNCAGVSSGNATNRFAAACNGKASCSLTPGDEDPARSCSKEFLVGFRCGAGTPLETMHLPGEAGGKKVTLTCGETIKVISASYGTGADSTVDNFLSRAQAQCDGHRLCDFGLPTGYRLFGSDPALGKPKTFQFKYLCGADSVVKSVDFGENDHVSFACPVGAARASYASGIRIVSATNGANCPKVDQGQLRNNALTLVTNACFGKDVCDYVHNGIGYDPVPFCPKDLDIDYRCGESPEVHSAKLQAESGTIRLSCEPAIKVVGASFGANCNLPANNALTTVGASCTGKRGSCSFDIASTLADPVSGCGETFSATYTCGADPAIKRIDLPANAATASFSCPTPSIPYVKKSCVPQQCYGRQKRDAELKCVADLTKPIVPAVALIGLSIADATTGVEASDGLRENTAYNISVAIRHSSALSSDTILPERRIASGALWTFDTFEPNAGGSRVEGFRCNVANIGLRAPGTDRLHLTGEALNVVIPSACFGENIGSWRDAAKRLGVNEAVFRSQYKLVGQPAIRLSFDSEGRTVALRTAGTTPSTALVPNPIGFFYDAPKLWVDSLSFYRQTDTLPPELGLPKRPFIESRDINLAATKAVVNTPSLRISLNDSFFLPDMEVDFSWVLQGDSPRKNPFSMTQRPLVASIPSLIDRKLGATIEITTKELYDARPSGADWVKRADSMTVGAVQGTKLKSGLATGKTERITGTFSPALRQRMLRIRSGGNGGWMTSATNTTTQLKVRVCLDLDGATRGDSDDAPSLSAKRGSLEFRAGFVTSKRCVVSDQAVVLTRELTMKPFAETRTGTNASQVGKSTDQGDAAVGTGNDIGGYNSCQRLCTVNADCAARQVCKQGTGGNSTGLGVCTGDEATSSCANVQRQSMGSTGSMGASQYSTTTSTASKKSSTKTGAKSDTDLEMLSFSVLDSSNGDSEKDSPFSFGWQNFSVSLVPNFSVIEKLIKGQALIPRPTPAEPRAKRFGLKALGAIERDGLSVGVGKELFFGIGPVPVMVELQAGVGIGMGLQLSVSLNSASQGDTSNPVYPCFGSNVCISLSSETATLTTARKACSESGGRLVELATAGRFSSLKSAITSATGVAANEEYWIGAQLAYGYSDPKCWDYFSKPSQMPADCVSGSTTRYQWISDATIIAEQSGTGSTLYNDLKYAPNFGGTSSALTPLRTAVPQLAGVAYVRGKDELKVGPADLTTKKRYVCEYEPASRYDAVKIGIAGSVEVSAGASFGICTPTNVFGFCITAGLKLIFAEIALTYEFSNINLFRASGSLLSTRQNHTILGTWQWGFLQGAISAELRLLFTTLGWDIVKYEGLQTLVAEKTSSEDTFSVTLFKIDWPSRKDYP